MGQKTHPKGIRLGISTTWDSIWYAEKNYPSLLIEDIKIRTFLIDRLRRAGISRIIIRRRADQVEVNLYAARPGMIIGKGGAEINLIKDELIKFLGKPVQLNIQEEENIELNSKLLADAIAMQLERRVAFRRAMKQVVNRTLKAGAMGVKVYCAGRLNGAEIARTEWYREGRVPLHTLRANIDYGFSEALTTYGKIGVKVWVYKGDILKKEEYEKSILELGSQKEEIVEES
jgi:small subunit ribosomal protein S3